LKIQLKVFNLLLFTDQMRFNFSVKFMRLAMMKLQIVKNVQISCSLVENYGPRAVFCYL